MTHKGEKDRDGIITREIEIVPLDDRHMEDLAALEERVFSTPWSLQSFRDLKKHDYCHYLVAEAGGRAVGIAGMTVLGDEGDIDKVMVEESLRRQGIARDLLEALLLLGTELGVENFTLEVRVSNEPAIGLYKSLGFVQEGIRPKFYRCPTEDALILWKRSANINP